MESQVKKYVLVGCGFRGVTSYAIPLINNYKDCAKLCGVYDINHKRAELVSKYAKTDVPVFDDFDKMLKEVNPDTVIVVSKDCSHDEYIISALKYGCDVISEKPLTTTFEKALSIKKAKDETNKDVRVTFNLRFHPFFKWVKEIVSSGVITIHLKLNGYAPKYSLEYLKNMRTEEKQKASHSKNDLLNGVRA